MPVMGRLQLSTPRGLEGSLPVDVRALEVGVSLDPALLFAPPHLRAPDRVVPLAPRAAAPVGGRLRSLSQPATGTSTSAITVVTTTPGDGNGDGDGDGNGDGDTGAGTGGATGSTGTTGSTNGSGGNGGNGGNGTVATVSNDVLPRAAELLDDAAGDGMGERFQADATNATYDFDEHLFLRSPDDPIAVGIGATKIPDDPRYVRFAAAAERGIGLFVDQALLGFYNPNPYLTAATTLRQTLMSWWSTVCGVRAFNRFGRYSRASIRSLFDTWGYPASIAAEDYYGYSLYWWLASPGTGVIDEAIGYFNGNGSSAALVDLLTVPFWEGVTSVVFDRYFDDNGIRLADPSASLGEYPFDPFPIDEVLFGVRVIHRQTWNLLGYARGELVKTIPLGPKESQKVSVKTTQRTRGTRTTETASSFETSSESGTTTRDSDEVVLESSYKLNRHIDAEVGGGYAPFFEAKVSAGLGDETGMSSKNTKTRLNETMEKTASRMKRDTKVSISTETESTFEATRSSEITNPNDELAVTYLYHRLQQRFWVSTEIAEVHSVVFVPESLPAWEDVNEDWVRAHGEYIADALLDPSFASVLAAIRTEPPNLAYSAGNVFTSGAAAGIGAANAVQAFTGGYMPDLLASGQQYYERDFERRNNLAMEQARRAYQSQALITHIRRNILHYMRAIWRREDYDQRMQRYSRLRAPIAWTFVPRTPLPGNPVVTPLEVDGVFMPVAGSARPLTEIIDPIGPIGYLFNCAIYRLRDNPKVINLHQALGYLRASYTHFAVNVAVSQGGNVTVRQATAWAPRSFAAQYTFTYRTQRQKWLMPIPGRSEGDWLELKTLPDGSIDALGLRIWLDGVPANQATLTVTLRSTSDLEDPHMRLVELRSPLPAAADEPLVFTDALLREMVSMFPDLAPASGTAPSWGRLTAVEMEAFRTAYHRFLMLRESGRLVTIDTGNVVLDLETSRTPALEPFKRLHRYIDVVKEYEEARRRGLDNTRREELLKLGRFGDPDVERVTLIGNSSSDVQELVAIADDPTE